MENIIDKTMCTGCSACFSICPKNAISMQTDNEGFKRPHIDKNKCINCKLCEKTCPILKKVKTSQEKSYACYNKNEESLINSSSGGIFTLLAEYILDHKGVVFGPIFDDNKLAHDFIENKKELYKLMGSKYLQSDMKNSYRQAKKFLDKKRLVLFTGTPCQIAGLKSFLRKDYENLYTQDIVCHGCPSPKIFDKYINSFNYEVDKISFRNKPNGWEHYVTTIIFKNKKFVNESHYTSKYMYLFINDFCLRPSCYNCQFKDYSRVSDITLADFWGVRDICPEMFNTNGTSLVLVNSTKGKKLFNSIKNNIEYKEVDRNKALKHNPSAFMPAPKQKARNSFMRDIDRLPFDILYKKYYYRKEFKNILKRKIKNQLGR